ncbi:23S rRNA pseudouridine(1911/1915/1917) synthase RluD [Legionella waltersii]|uniref:Pseudouridine synthase n=1 Tax=Legionella waltersii TaxID=66969 RepID=A0A0W1ALX9_9GAMM|nr:23S rRNA pseudouridine(1911/1915/1917) synthase RluD [Legionella waltersii]KTD82363.1 ribosomal large subunit pseudouridine synthase D [Legionella waltersii]SNV03695.1 ribosomal large subunit pseudouridine synthase D [Legionella waltersii]
MIEHIQKQFAVTRDLHNKRLDVVVSELMPEYSRSQISSWIKSNSILVNEKPYKPKDKAQEGDRISINVQFEPINPDFNVCKPENIPLNIVYEDDDVLVINKQAGLVVHPGAGNREHTLVNALLHHAPSLQHLARAGIIHRLDKDTTGLLIVAKNLKAHNSLTQQMQAREINRQYITLVYGHIISGSTIETGFGRHPKNRLKMTVCDHGREAITHYSINKQYFDFTLLDVQLMTGRTHQIRVHLNYIKHPVVGDPLYGGRVRFPAQASQMLIIALQQFKRQALHAAKIEFIHPANNKKLIFTAALPDDFSTLLKTMDEDYENKKS